MNTFDRRNHIIDLVNTNGSVLVSDISSGLGVSEVTIRADLRLLEKRGLLARFHGGAAKTATSSQDASVNKELNLNDRYKVAADPKRRIAAAAANLVREGDTIILDSGSTTKLLAEELLERTNITVITNNLAAAYVLADNKDITLVVCGGTIRHKTVSLHGALAEYALRDVAANIMFVGADGLDGQNGITTFNEGYAISSSMAAVANQVVVITDSSKFGRKGFNIVLPIEKIDMIITDSDAPASEIEHFKEIGKKMIVV
ncbi:DeoR/GlpR family DNA-binding transcription regulator [Yersinia enterocolitica]